MLWWRLIFWAVGEPHNHKTTLPDTLLCLCLSSHRRRGPARLFLPCCTPHQGLCSVGGGQQMGRKSGPRSISLFSEQRAFRSHMSCSSVSCGWIRCCPRLRHRGLLLCHSLSGDSWYFGGSDRLKILLCLSSLFVFLGKLVNVAEHNT